MGRRNGSLRFMGGHHVFLGGAVGSDETANHVINAPDEPTALGVHAAAREIFEEAGLLCAEGTLPDTAVRQAAHIEMLEGRATFDDLLERFGLTVDAAQFEGAGHWITPAASPIRFNTNYFLYRMQRPQQEHLVSGEMVALDWMTPAQARRRWQLGEIELSTPVSTTLHILSGAPYPECLPILQRPKEDEAGSPRRLELLCGVSILPLKSRTIPPATHTNCILIGEKELLIVDPAASNEPETKCLERYLELYRDLGATVKAILLTHSHTDHIDSVEFVRDAFDAPVWAHEAIAPQVSFPIDRFVQDGEIITSAGDPGWRVRAIHTLGHDPGHLCYFEESTKILICGDMMANPGTIVVSHDYGGDMTQFIDSLERLMQSGAGYLIPGHGDYMKDAHAALKGHRDHRLWREDKIKKALDQGADTIKDLLEQAYDDAPREALGLAEQSLKAHLARLGVTLEE